MLPLPISDLRGDASQDWVVPMACTLPTMEQPMRVAEFTTLFADALTSVQRVTTTRVRIALAHDEVAAARAQDLASRETECCSFFAFTITSTSAVSAVMDLTVPDVYANVLAAFVDMAQAAHRRTPIEGLDA